MVSFICFYINIEAQTFFWLSGNGDCSEVVDDVVKRPSLLYVLLQHRHAVFNEDLEPSRPDGKQVLFVVSKIPHFSKTVVLSVVCLNTLMSDAE